MTVITGWIRDSNEFRLRTDTTGESLSGNVLGCVCSTPDGKFFDTVPTVFLCSSAEYGGTVSMNIFPTSQRGAALAFILQDSARMKRGRRRK